LCADGSDYVGSARGESLEKRLGEHQAKGRATARQTAERAGQAEWLVTARE
jgi:putative endonuclease